MTRKRSRFSRLEGLKMPFVVTMTLGAAGGCGGTVTERAGESDGTGGTSGGGRGQAGSGGFIERGGTSPIGSGGQYELGGAYPTGGGGNPPYPPVDTVCPAAPPGGVCNYQGPACGYYDCYGHPTTTAACLDGVWSLSMSSCNPPAPPVEPCPVLPPQAGSYCNYVGDACGYHEQGCNNVSISAECNAHAWTVVFSLCGSEDGGTEALDSGESAYRGQ
jgi:hypothetical protein